MVMNPMVQSVKNHQLNKQQISKAQFEVRSAEVATVCLHETSGISAEIWII